MAFVVIWRERDGSLTLLIRTRELTRYRGDGEVSEKSRWKRVKAPVDSIPKAHTRLPDAALASGVRYCGCERAGGVYAAVAQDAKIEILNDLSYCCVDGQPSFSP